VSGPPEPGVETPLWEAPLWEALCAAAAGAPGPVAELATVDGSPRLGWVLPPPWPAVEAAVGRVGPAAPLVVATTGGWAFGLRALAEAAARSDVLVLDVLDPAAVDGARGTVLAVSASGGTAETVALASALGQRLRTTPRWLTGRMLSPAGLDDQVALFAAPLSTPFLAVAALLFDGMEHRYARFVAEVGRIGPWAERAAAAPWTVLGLPPGAGEGLAAYALQAVHQGLGGKSPGEPWREVTVGPARASSDTVIEIPDFREPDPLVRVMLTCYAVNAVVACTGVRSGLRFAEHAGVDTYKRLIGRPAAPVAVEPSGIVPFCAAWARDRTGLRRGHLVSYEPAFPAGPAAAELTTRTGIPWQPGTGSRWNHHSFQTVNGRDDTGVVVVGPPSTAHPLSRLQADIAAATAAALGARAAHVRVDDGGNTP
jgi:hypothetical protein